MKVRTRIMYIGVLLVLVLWIFVPLTIGVTVGNAVLAEVLAAIDEEDLAIADPASEGETEEDNNVEYTIGVNCFDELHRKILLMDLSKVDDKNYIQGLSSKVTPILMGNGKPFPLKAYLRLYALAAEICLREEINPKGASVKINPTDLIGESFCEAGLMNYGATVNNFNSDGKLKDTIQIWLPEGYLTDMGISGEALVQQPGADWGSAWTSETIASSYRLANCPSFFGQALFYSYCWSADYGDVCVGVYISKEENPDLADDKRAIWGCRKDIYNGRGKYVTGDFWATDYENKLKNASSAEIASNIKSGTFEQGKEFGYKTRPASYYLPDSMYTHALQIRSFLRNRAAGSNNMHAVDESGIWSVSNLDKFCTGANADQREYLAVIKKMFVLSRFMGDYQLGSNFVKTNEKTLGDLPAAYMRFVNEEVNPLVTESIVGTELGSSLMGQSNSFCYVFIHGDSTLDKENKHHLFTKSENGPIELVDLDGKLNGSQAGNHTLYGFDCINAGSLAYPAFKTQIEGAYYDYIQKYPPNPVHKDTNIPKAQKTSKLCWPLAATTNQVAKNGYYGQRSTDKHPGVDIITGIGDKVYSIAAGAVIAIIDMPFAGEQSTRCIIIEHGTDSETGLTLCSWYANLAPSSVAVGDEVSQRQPIGTVGQLTHEWCGLGYENEPGDYKQPSIEGRSFLHFSICLYDKDQLDVYARYPDSAWEFSIDGSQHPEYAASSINPVCLTWYSSTADDAAVVDILSHDSQPLRSVYNNIGNLGDNSESYRWNTSFNYQMSILGEKEKPALADAISSGQINEAFYGVSTELTITNYDTCGAVIQQILAALYKDTLSRQQGGYAGVDGVTSIFGISCGPPIPEQYFNANSITQSYGNPSEDILLGTNLGGHAGTDLSISRVCEILAVAEGTVYAVCNNQPDDWYQANPGSFQGGAFGNYVIIQLKDNRGNPTNIYVKYSHMKLGSVQVQPGDTVKKGTPLGIMGNSGVSLGKHLHLELWITDEILFNQFTLAKGCKVRYYGFSNTLDPGMIRPTLDPWLLYCMNPSYDWFQKKGYTPAAIFTYKLRVPGGQPINIVLDPVNNPGFRDELKNPFNY